MPLSSASFEFLHGEMIRVILFCQFVNKRDAIVCMDLYEKALQLVLLIRGVNDFTSRRNFLLVQVHPILCTFVLSSQLEVVIHDKLGL